MSILQGTMWFAILLNLKHLYIYVAPAYTVWLLKSYCLDGKKFFKRLFSLGLIVLTILTVSFGPFRTQLAQVIFIYFANYILSLLFNLAFFLLGNFPFISV